MDFTKDLNTNQINAVETAATHVRVVAGAGSGKTRVLTYRIAYLLREMHVDPWNILAITFTNKVAKEMKERVVKLVPEASDDLTIKTFHSFAAFFLRHEIGVLGFPRSFSILDEEDTTKLIKDLAVEAGYKRSDPIVKQTINYIGKQKLKEKYPEDIVIDKISFENEKECLAIYERYEEEKNKMYALDFDDLLLKANEILGNYMDVRIKWQSKFRHILVDEFQDTNDTEYRLLNYLLTPSTSLYVVGDPDQTIYTWRGANQDIILGMEKRFPDMETIILDRNYRSTQAILDSANKLIENNRMRVHKNLYTKNNEGCPIVIKGCNSTRSEADYVVRQIKLLRDVGNRPYSDICLLYRSNYITQEFEQALTQNQIPYRVYGGTKFYQRKEIKDVVSYFRLIINSKDDLAFERIINVPTRGIGETSVNRIKKEAADAGLSIYEYITSVLPEDSEAPKKAIITLKTLIARIDETRIKIESYDEIFSKHLEDFITDIGYKDYLLKEDDGDDRLQNVNAIFEDIRHFLLANPEATFDEYLQNIALLSAQDDYIDGNYVSLMTVHTAKGLEFPVVFVVRLNDAVFPNQRAVMESGHKALEEERRLCYVAFTRAQEKLYLSYSNDYSYVVGGQLVPSRFIKESGNKIAEEQRPVNRSIFGSSQPTRSSFRSHPSVFDDGPNLSFESDVPKKPLFGNVHTNDVEGWAVGDTCIHKKFGQGRVIAVEGDGVIKVRFDTEGVKTLMGNHPSLRKGGHEA